MNSSTPHSTLRVVDGIATVTLTRPKNMNAFTIQMADELCGYFDACSARDDVRVVVLTGEGKAFCAGADLSIAGANTFSAAADEENGGTSAQKDNASLHRDSGGRVSLAIYRCNKPVIAAINGAAVGIGITMCLAADIRIVARKAKIGFVFTRRGIVMEACSSYFLPRIVGPAKAAEWVYTGRVFPAETEASSGLFSYVVDQEHVLEAGMKLAKDICDNASPVSVGMCKELMRRGESASSTPESQHLLDSRCMHWVAKHGDAFEGVASFIEKRPPQFTLKSPSDMPDFLPPMPTLSVALPSRL